jgi:ATP-dependent Clp protease adapter protein ClpS
LIQHVAEHASFIPTHHAPDTQPTAGFQRVIQNAILKVQSSGKMEVSGADVLLAIFSDKQASAVTLLKQVGINRSDVAGRMDQAGEQSDDLEAPAPSTGKTLSSTSPIAKELEVSLHMAFAEGRQKRHELMTVEHLLLALLDNPSASEVLRACTADIDALRKLLADFVAEHTPVLAGEEADTQPTLGFQRVIQRAILHVQASSKKEVTGVDVLVAIFGERDSYAVYVLQQQGIVRLNVVTYISHGVTSISKVSEAQTADNSDVQVVLYNDDHTPMEFVVEVLQNFFSMDREDATEAMLEVHREGQAVCGLYSREDGEAVVEQVLAHARHHGHPLRCATVVQKP